MSPGAAPARDLHSSRTHARTMERFRASVAAGPGPWAREEARRRGPPGGKRGLMLLVYVTTPSWKNDPAAVVDGSGRQVHGYSLPGEEAKGE